MNGENTLLYMKILCNRLLFVYRSDDMDSWQNGPTVMKNSKKANHCKKIGNP